MVGIALIAVAGILGASEQTWVSTGGTIEFGVTHPLHDVVGKSKQVQAVASMAGTRLEGAARIAVQSFDSGNANRDAHMLEVIEATKHRFAMVQFAVADFALPAPGARAKLTVKGQVSLRGAKTEVPIELEVSSLGDGSLTVSFAFADSLDAHGIERPALMFVPLNDELHISGTVTLRPKP